MKGYEEAPELLKNQNIDLKIEKMRDMLYQSIEENGLNSEKTKKMSEELNNFINLYYNTKNDK